MAASNVPFAAILHPALGVLIATTALVALAILPRIVPMSRGLQGRPAPVFALDVVANGATDARINLGDLRGRPILLDFWASWCGPCALEAPVVDRLARRYAKKGLVVVGVNTSDSPEVVRAYAARKGLSYPMVVDESGSVSAQYGVHHLPTLVIIDKQGNVQSFTPGLIDDASLSELVAGVL